MSENQQIVVVGGGPAAHRFVESLLSRPGANHSIVVLTEEPHHPYDRVALTSRLNGEVDLTLTPDVWADHRVTMRTHARVDSIDTAARTVGVGEDTIAYDDLVIATGSYALVPPITNADRGRVYRTIDDIDSFVTEIAQLRERHGRPPRVVVVGGGLLGLEAAGGAAALGAQVSIVNSGAWLMGVQLDQGAGQALGRIIGDQGIDLHLGTVPTEIVLDDDDQVTGTRLSNGELLEADLVMFSIGVRPRDELARQAGIALGEFGGVAVDLACRTSAPHVWAIGEVAAVDGQRPIGLVAPANAMAEVVADRLHGGPADFPGIDDATKLKLSGVDVASFGDAHARADGALEVVYADPARGLYQKLVVSDDAKTLLGGIFVGDASPYTSLRPMLGRELGAEPGAFLSAAGEAPTNVELPDDAQLCSCNNVSVGEVRTAVDGGCHQLGELKTCTRAGTQCGSCVPLLQRLLDTELTKHGIEVSKALCEHVSLSRAELYETVRILGLTSAEAVMERLDIEVGCDICKPTIASVLATQTNGYILDNGQGPLQDTNDRALANMQKDGTYSVVPRIPGGEITPQKLKVIAEVAEQFGLYTKITGGQRIDMFGARLEQLPEIWKILIDAGMESGQAYGKSLRTVKSCVGSTWCRYGVQDSVGMAILLEERYRGLRAPHKLKLGVSGCARECAEARSKDLGVIATELGWNLYVGGNGGFQPAHAVLLAGDIDDRTLIAYIDRYIMYYIRTADRLQRTARWQEALPGGLDQVREVVCEDSLGIGAELEQAVEMHRASYRDEWAATLDSPERLRRFRSFVNAPQTPDPSLRSVVERGQRRPANGQDSLDQHLEDSEPSGVIEVTGPESHGHDAARLAGPVPLGATIPLGAPGGTTKAGEQ